MVVMAIILAYMLGLFMGLETSYPVNLSRWWVLLLVALFPTIISIVWIIKICVT